MKTIKQILRRPVKTLSGMLIVALAFTILVTCVGQYTATALTRKNLDDRYDTVAVYNDEYFWKKSEFGGVSHLTELPEETQVWVDETIQTRTDLVKTLSETGFLSSYSPGLRIDNFSKYEFGSYIDKGLPYCCAMLEITLTDIGTVYYENMGRFTGSNGEQGEFLYETKMFCVGTVDRVLGLEAGFVSPVGKKILLEVTVYSAEDVEALGLCVGEKYLVYGMSFSNDVEEELFSIYQSSYEELFGELNYKGVLIQSFDYSPILEQIGCYMEICDFSSIPNHQPAHDENNEFIGFEPVFDRRILYDENKKGQYIPVEEYIAAYQLPTFAHLSGSAEVFLESAEGALWRKWLESIEICNHGFPVLCVDKLGYQAAFFREDTRIVDGRDFTESEIVNGEKVCIISQSQALRNGLNVGDTIQLRPYGFDPNINPEHELVLGAEGFPSAFVYCETVGFTSEMETYTIVGLYRQNNAWENYTDPYGFTPNTIFVPKASVTAPMMTFTKGVFSTLVLHNGKMEKFKALMQEAGYPALLICYDQGYTEIVATLDSYEEVSQKALYIGFAAFCVVILLFLLLFPMQERRSLVLLSTMGASAWRKISHTFFSTLWILVPGAVLGGYAGSKLWTKIAAALMDWINIQITLDSDMNAVAPKLTVVSLIVVAFAVLLVSVAQCGSRKLMKRK